VIAEESFYIVHVDYSIYHADDISGGLEQVPVLGWRAVVKGALPSFQL
jgi:hypothetical protein